MRRRISSIMLAEFLFIACAVQFLQAQEPHKPSARQVYRRWGVPITSMLLPGETRLEIVQSGSAPLPVRPPDGMSTIAWTTHLSDVVIRVCVVSRQSMLTQDEDWIVTSVQIKILQVLKSPGRGLLNVGQEVSFMEQGGSLDVAGRQIDATVEWARRFEVGKEYLIFASFTSANKLVPGLACSFEILPGGSLRWLLKTDQLSESMRLSDYILKSSLKNIRLNNALEDIQLQVDMEK